jgi:hypothetical protein
MREPDIRDERLGDVLDRAARGYTPSVDIERVVRWGSRRRLLQAGASLAAVALFVAVVVLAAATFGREEGVAPAPVSLTYAADEVPWTFSYPDDWSVRDWSSAAPSSIANVTETFVSNVPLPEGWSAGPNGPEPLPSSVPPSGAIVLISRVWTLGSPIEPGDYRGREAFAEDAQNPGWTFNEVPRCVGTLCFHVLEWFGPETSDAERATADAIAASVTLAPVDRWRESDGVFTTLHDETRLFAVTYPNEGWSVASENLTPWLSKPVEILSLGTSDMPVSHDPDDELRVFDAPVAPLALAGMTSTDAFVSVQDFGPTDRPDDRPEDLQAFVKGDPCCFGPDLPFTAWWVPFVDHGRQLYVFVAIGNGASDKTTDHAWTVSDSLRFIAPPTS